MDNVTRTTVPGNLSVDVESSAYRSAVFIVFGVVLGLESLAGALCNVTVLIVHRMKKGKLSNNLNDSAATPFLTTLSAVDLLISTVSIPMTMARIWMALAVAPVFCILHEATVSMATTSSALALMLVSLDRYLAIVRPFRGQLSRANAPYVLTAMWALVAVGLAFPVVALMPKPLGVDSWARATADIGAAGSVSCFLWIRKDGGRILYEIYYVVVYGVANVVMLTCYGNIFRTAKRRINTRMSLIRAAVSNLPGAPQMNLAGQKSRERRITRMTLMIVLTFFVCWAPHAVASAVVLAMDAEHLEMVHLVCLVLAYSTTVIHPILYSFMRDDFRKRLCGRQNAKQQTDDQPKIAYSQRRSISGMIRHNQVDVGHPVMANSGP